MNTTRLLFISLCSLLASCKEPLGSGNYDLVAASVQADPNPIVSGQGFVLTIEIKNEGTTDLPTGYYEMNLFIDGVLQTFDTRGGAILAGRNKTYKKPFDNGNSKWATPGEHTYRLIVQPNSALKEASFSNNTLSGTLTVE